MIRDPRILLTPRMAGATHDMLCRDLCARSGGCVDTQTIEWFFDHAVSRSHRTDWRFAPLHVDHLDGVAPACIVLAECDSLFDEGLAYADRLRAAGVAVTLDLARGVAHEFILMGRALPEADAAQEFAASTLADAWSRA